MNGAKPTKRKKTKKAPKQDDQNVTPAMKWVVLLVLILGALGVFAHSPGPFTCGAFTSIALFSIKAVFGLPVGNLTKGLSK